MLALRFLPLVATGAGGKTVGLSTAPYGVIALIVIGQTLSLRRGAVSP